MVHASMRRVGRDGEHELVGVRSTRQLARTGTWMMTLGAHRRVELGERASGGGAALCSLGSPVFDPLTAPPIPDMGVLAEVFRTTAGHGGERSPEGRFGARGRLAEELMADVPWDDYYGAGLAARPIRATRADRVLRLGADIDTVTLFHWAEYWRRSSASGGYRRHRLVLGADGRPEVRVVDTLDDSDGIADYPGVDEDEFGVILRGYLATGGVIAGVVGGPRRAHRRPVLVKFAVDWIVAHALR